jgi:hypothetical protein
VALGEVLFALGEVTLVLFVGDVALGEVALGEVALG